MKYTVLCLFCLALSGKVLAISPDFISKFVENSKMVYADNGYRVVHEKVIQAYDLSQGNTTLAYQLDPGEYFAQLITEPCLKMDMEVLVAQENEQGVVSEKPEMRAAIAIFDVPAYASGLKKTTEIKLSGPALQYCYPAKARLVVYQRVSY